MIYLVSLVVPVTLCTYLAWSVFDFFLPILGRCGPVIPSEIVVAILTGTFTLGLFLSVV